MNNRIFPKTEFLDETPPTDLPSALALLIDIQKKYNALVMSYNSLLFEMNQGGIK
jgi:hypothetical protein